MGSQIFSHVRKNLSVDDTLTGMPNCVSSMVSCASPCAMFSKIFTQSFAPRVCRCMLS